MESGLNGSSSATCSWSISQYGAHQNGLILDSHTLEAACHDELLSADPPEVLVWGTQPVFPLLQWEELESVKQKVTTVYLLCVLWG